MYSHAAATPMRGAYEPVMKARSVVKYMLAPMPQPQARYRLCDVVIGDTRGTASRGGGAA
jgi:hypothetical protein